MLESIGFQISLNTPYSGGYIIKEYSSTIEAIQIELNYQTYIDHKIFGKEEFPNRNEQLFLTAQKQLQEFFIQLIDYCSK